MRTNQTIIATMNPVHQAYIIKLLEYVESSEIEVKALVVYGSSVNHTHHQASDVDVYIFSDDPKRHLLSRTVIIQGVGYDVFVVNTEFLLKIVNFEIDLLPLIIDGVALFVKNDQTCILLEQYRQQAKKNLHDSQQLNQAVLRHKNEKSKVRSQIYRSTSEQEALLYFQTWLYHHTCLKAYETGTYLMHGIKSMIFLLQNICHRHIQTEILEVIYSQSLLDSIHKFINLYDPLSDTEKVIIEEKSEFVQMNHSEIKEYFQELVSYFKKVEHAYLINDAILLFNYVCSLQRELNVLLPSMNIGQVELVTLIRGDLSRLTNEVALLELKIRNRLNDMKIILNEYDSVDDWIL